MCTKLITPAHYLLHIAVIIQHFLECSRRRRSSINVGRVNNAGTTNYHAIRAHEINIALTGSLATNGINGTCNVNLVLHHVN